MTTAPTIQLTVVQHGQTTVTVDRAQYDVAVRHGALEFLLETATARLALHTDVIAPDGSTHQPFQAVEQNAVHGYANMGRFNYFVLHRSLLQSMPAQWQTRFVHLLRELDAAFAHIEQPGAFEVTPGTEHLVSDLNEAGLRKADIEVHHDDPSSDTDDDEADDEDEGNDDYTDTTRYYKDGEEITPDAYYVLIPTDDPIPDYNRGRTHIPPVLLDDGEGSCGHSNRLATVAR